MQSKYSAVLFTALMLASGPAIGGECSLAQLKTDELVYSYPDRAEPSFAPDTRVNQSFLCRIGSSISAEDARRILNATGLDLDPDTDGDGRVTFQIGTALNETRTILEGPCEGVTIGPYNRTLAFMPFRVEGGVDIVIPFMLVDSKLGPTPSFETNGQIEISLRHADERLECAVSVSNSDETFDVDYAVTIPANAEFKRGTLDLKTRNFRIITATKRADNSVLWAYEYRMGFTEKDPGALSLTATKVCSIAGEPDLCVELAKPTEGRIYRNNELLLRYEPLN